MADPLTPQEERDALAAELALGVLTGPERAEALRLQLSDPAFAALVQDWEARLAPLHGAWQDIAPRDAVWDAVAARIADPVARLQMQLSRWRAGALLSGAVAATLAAVIVIRTGDAPAPVAAPTAIAQLGSTTSGPLVLARYDPQAVEMRLHIVGISDAALSPELWVIPDGGAPISLGLIPRTGRTAVPLSAHQRQLLVEGATLAVTMEPEDGAPHAAPSSAPVAAGKISIL